MKLFEVAGNKFQDDLVNTLKILQGRANTKQTQSEIPWPAINNMLASSGYAEIDADLIDKIKDKIDPNGDLIQNVTPQGITLKTDVSSPDEPSDLNPNPRGGKSVDQMAHNAVAKGL